MLGITVAVGSTAFGSAEDACSTVAVAVAVEAAVL